MLDAIPLDCGHAVAQEYKHCFVVLASGSTRCYDCATAADRELIAHPDTFNFDGRLSADEHFILNGIGGRLATVTSRTGRFPGMVRLLRVQSFDGRQWKWTGPEYQPIMTFHLDKERHGL